MSWRISNCRLVCCVSGSVWRIVAAITSSAVIDETIVIARSELSQIMDQRRDDRDELYIGQPVITDTHNRPVHCRLSNLY